MQLSNDDIKATGLTSTADVLNTVPSVLQLGGGNAYAGGAYLASPTATPRAAFAVVSDGTWRTRPAPTR